MAGRPKSRERHKQRIIAALEGGYVPRQKEVDWLAREWGKQCDVKAMVPFTAEDAAEAREQARALRRARMEGRLEGEREAAKATIKRLSHDAVTILGIAMQKLQDEVLVRDENGEPTGKIDTTAAKAETLKMAMTAARDILDRSEGKATQKFEGKVDHEHTFWHELEQKGILDA